MRKKRKCLECGKGTYNRKFCSQEHYYKYFKRNKLGRWNSKLQSKMGKVGGQKAAITNRKNGTSMCFNKKSQSEGGKIGGNIRAKQMKRDGTGFFDSKVGIMGAKAAGYFDSERQRELGRRGGSKTADILRKNKKIIFNSIHFSSILEMEFAMNIHYQIEKLVEGINYQVKVGSKTFDFKVEKYKCFIEYHPWDWYKMSDEEYYDARRKTLDENGCKDYKLIVIK